MAFRDVEPDSFEPRNFYKFTAIGDKLAGWFVKTVETTAFEKPATEYTFRDKDGVDWTITPSGALKQQLAKAALKPGNRAIITYTGNKDIGKPSPMKTFKVQVDDEITQMPAKKAAAAQHSSDPFA